jgi:isocitrate lyase
MFLYRNYYVTWMNIPFSDEVRKNYPDITLIYTISFQWRTHKKIIKKINY